MQCAKKFMDNGCAAVTRFPALEKSCNEWEECMHREVVVVGKTRVVAETLAEVVNGFVEVISFKTMVRRCSARLSLPLTSSLTVCTGAAVCIALTRHHHLRLVDCAVDPRLSRAIRGTSTLSLGAPPLPFAAARLPGIRPALRCERERRSAVGDRERRVQGRGSGQGDEGAGSGSAAWDRRGERSATGVVECEVVLSDRPCKCLCRSSLAV